MTSNGTESTWQTIAILLGRLIFAGVFGAHGNTPSRDRLRAVSRLQGASMAEKPPAIVPAWRLGKQEFIRPPRRDAGQLKETPSAI